MAGPNPETPFRRIEELAQENEGLREQLRQKQAELEEADAEIKRLRQELKEAQRAGPHQNTKRKKKPNLSFALQGYLGQGMNGKPSGCNAAFWKM